jgi:hypothetical protein
VGLRSSYWVDRQTDDVVLLDLAADAIPPTLPISDGTTSIHYSRTRLSDSLLVLPPDSAEFPMAKFTGEISHNRIEFTHCRVFSAEATLSFGATDAPEQAPRFGVSAIDDTPRPLPGGLQIAVTLRSRISDDMAVGALIDGVGAVNVSVK